MTLWATGSSQLLIYLRTQSTSLRHWKSATQLFCPTTNCDQTCKFCITDGFLMPTGSSPNETITFHCPFKDTWQRNSSHVFSLKMTVTCFALILLRCSICLLCIQQPSWRRGDPILTFHATIYRKQKDFLFPLTMMGEGVRKGRWWQRTII